MIDHGDGAYADSIFSGGDIITVDDRNPEPRRSPWRGAGSRRLGRGNRCSSAGARTRE